MATQAAERTAGDRVCNIGRLGSKMAKGYPIWTGAIFEAQPRKRDGVLTWRRVGSFGDTRSGRKPSAAFLAEVQAASPHEWCDDASHNVECNWSSSIEQAWQDAQSGYGDDFADLCDEQIEG